MAFNVVAGPPCLAATLGMRSPQKIFRPERAAQNVQTIFLCDPFRVVKMGGATVTQGGDLRSYPGLSCVGLTGRTNNTGVLSGHKNMP